MIFVKYLIFENHALHLNRVHFNFRGFPSFVFHLLRFLIILLNILVHLILCPIPSFFIKILNMQKPLFLLLLFNIFLYQGLYISLSHSINIFLIFIRFYLLFLFFVYRPLRVNIQLKIIEFIILFWVIFVQRHEILQNGERKSRLIIY